MKEIVLKDESDLDKKVADLLKLPMQKMYKEIHDNVKYKLVDDYFYEINMRICPWDEAKDTMLNTMSVYEVAYRLRYPLRWVKKRVADLGVIEVKLPEKTSEEIEAAKQKTSALKQDRLDFISRNNQIYEAINAGQTRVALAAIYGISNNRVSQIYEKEKLLRLKRTCTN